MFKKLTTIFAMLIMVSAQGAEIVDGVEMLPSAFDGTTAPPSRSSAQT